jgi:uncharacterized protein YdiU (UPF0061 family)
MNLRFDNSFVRDLPADPLLTNQRRQVVGAGFSRVTPTPVAAPKLLAHSAEMQATLGLDTLDVAALSGNAILDGMDPYAACYGGHQFGNWAGQLGDGRAITLGEHLAPDGQRWELQLKGAGPTPYSRSGDGRAVLRSSIREFLCSEAMHHLGVPTTRALSLVQTGDVVVRDMFYSGNPMPEHGAIVCRVAPSFIRFGNFEIFASRRDPDTAKLLAEHVLARHYPDLGTGKEAYPKLLDAVCRRTATMVAHWMRVGFVHGVMNTDNMSILGLTIDYGPYGWLEDYDPGWTPNTTDRGQRRYRFGQQPQVAYWNLVQLASALVPLVGSPEPLQSVVEQFPRYFAETYNPIMAAKLGLPDLGEGDADLLDGLFELLAAEETDMTLFFRGLADVPRDLPENAEARIAPVLAAFYAPPGPDLVRRWGDWLALRAQRLDGRPDAERKAAMDAVNPLYVMRNYLAQLAIDAANEGDASRIAETLEVMRRPYTEQAGRAEYAEKRPEWARSRPGCSMLSCSS